MCIRRIAAFNFPRNLLSSGESLFVLWVAPVDGGGVQVLVVASLNPVEARVRLELIPRARGPRGRILADALEGEVDVRVHGWLPTLEVPFADGQIAGDVCVGAETGRYPYIRQLQDPSPVQKRMRTIRRSGWNIVKADAIHRQIGDFLHVEGHDMLLTISNICRRVIMDPVRLLRRFGFDMFGHLQNPR